MRNRLRFWKQKKTRSITLKLDSKFKESMTLRRLKRLNLDILKFWNFLQTLLELNFWSKYETNRLTLPHEPYMIKWKRSETSEFWLQSMKNWRMKCWKFKPWVIRSKLKNSNLELWVTKSLKSRKKIKNWSYEKFH